jgi:hypothetical protein
MRRSAGKLAALFLLATSLGALTGCSAIGSKIPEPTGVPAKTASANVYYATGRTLVEESKVVDASDLYASTLGEWLKASPKSNPSIAIVQPVAEPLSVKLDAQGMLTIDWPSEVLGFKAESQEQLVALAGILRTMGQFPEVKKVRFTVEGKTSGSIDGKDIEKFWGGVSLKAQPWDVLRPQGPPASQESSSVPQP